MTTVERGTLGSNHVYPDAPIISTETGEVPRPPPSNPLFLSLSIPSMIPMVQINNSWRRYLSASASLVAAMDGPYSQASWQQPRRPPSTCSIRDRACRLSDPVTCVALLEACEVCCSGYARTSDYIISRLQPLTQCLWILGVVYVSHDGPPHPRG